MCHRGVEQWKLVGLITRRSLVRIQPPLPRLIGDPEQQPGSPYCFSRGTATTHEIVDQLRQSLIRCNLMGSRLIVAVSGGPDSVALAHGIAALRDPLGLEVHLAHANHHLRPESDADEQFVAGLASLLGLPLTIGQLDVRRVTRHGRGIEEAARRERYRFLARLQQQLDAAAVAVGHTADDQTETRLMHWLRGSGLSGLVGMREDNCLHLPGEPPVRLVRPLLKTSRRATEEYCRQHGLTPRLDDTNLDRTYTRNRLRHDIVPALRALNPRLDLTLERLARIADEADHFIATELERRLPALVQPIDSGWLIARDRWHDLPPALKRALLRRAADAVTGDRDVLDATNVEQGMHAADSWPAGRTLHWPRGLILRVEREHLVIGAAAPPAPPLSACEIPLATVTAEPLVLELGPVAHLGPLGTTQDGQLTVRRTHSPCSAPDADPWHCDLDLSSVEGSVLRVRSRRDGDWMMPEGAPGRKKVHDILIEASVPRRDRPRVPVVETASGIAWLAGVRRDRRFIARPESRTVLCLKVSVSESAVTGEAALRESTACTP
jgi:tRNA(Ile)-lysidine synthase